MALSFTALRQQHPRLYYRGFTAKKQASVLEVTFDFFLEPDLHFAPRYLFFDFPFAKHFSSPLADGEIRDQLPKLWQQLFFQLGLAELPSYWKAACSPEIILDDQEFPLSPAAQTFWQNLLIHGLGEFFYQNQIDFTAAKFVTWQSSKPAQSAELKQAEENWQKTIESFQAASVSESLAQLSTEPLVPVGGGKDSATLLGLLEQKEKNYRVLLLEPHSPAAREIAKHFQKTGHCQGIIRVQRRIDPELLRLNQAGYLNGHTPFSAVLAFVSVISAYFYGQQEVLLSNEASADEENSVFHGQEINHQYSKSSAFEAQFQRYNREELFAPNVCPVNYYSLFRQLDELAITEIFCQLWKKDQRLDFVLEHFRSCNVGQQAGVWCHHCPKCAFVFLMFSAFLPPQIVSQKIFAKNLFDEETLQSTYFDLLGFGDKKPFECVGTFAECRKAALLAKEQYVAAAQTIPQVLKALLAKLNSHSSAPASSAKTQFPLWEKANAWCQQQANKKICILGLGREGLSSYHFLRQFLPNKLLRLADQNPLEKLDPAWQTIQEQDQQLEFFLGSHYEQALEQQELILKTAGIPATLPFIQAALLKGAELSSQTAIFFDLVDHQNLIGITGTKGKSTTSTLLFELLKTAPEGAILVGNIGQPALDGLATLSEKTRVVYELSAHQLAELHKSPHIAIVQEIFPEHLDYYKDFESYFAAKTAIVRYQTPEDICIYDPDLAGASRMAALSPAKKWRHRLAPNGAELCLRQIDDQEWLFETKPQEMALLPTQEIPLLGRHNLYNVMAAVACARLFNIPPEGIRETVAHFKSLPHRLEFVAKTHGVTYIEDSIATNPPAAIKALEAFPKGKILLLAGGYDRHLDFLPLVEKILERQVKALLLFPSTGETIAKLLREQAAKQQKALPFLQMVSSMSEAVEIAKSHAVTGDVVLLSPGSASFGLFKDYRDRGEQFRHAVQQLIPKETSEL
jgi:UDP-N-acetylmuramoylalanine--D-glutamate ligase